MFDDHPAVESARFAELVKETEKENNFFLIFSRTRIGNGKLDRLNIATTSILKLVTSSDGKHHYTEPYHNQHEKRPY